jgi:hypothetical protein
MDSSKNLCIKGSCKPNVDKPPLPGVHKSIYGSRSKSQINIATYGFQKGADYTIEVAGVREVEETDNKSEIPIMRVPKGSPRHKSKRGFAVVQQINDVKGPTGQGFKGLVAKLDKYDTYVETPVPDGKVVFRRKKLKHL